MSASSFLCDGRKTSQVLINDQKQPFFVTSSILHPVAALQIVKPMKDASVAETQAATFECEVSHFNVPSTWLKDGVEIEMSEKFRIVVQGKLHQLKIMNTSKDDSAEYTFICGNDRVSATLTVSRKFSSQPRANKVAVTQPTKPRWPRL